MLNGHSSESGFPIKWSPTENIAWKVSIPGKGHSSPIVWDNRVFLTTCIENQKRRQLLCLDRADGKILWQKDVAIAPLERKNDLNSYATPTPATDGKLVFTSLLNVADVIVAAYDFDGNEVWRKSVGKFRSMHGYGVGPILYKDLVIVNCDHDGDGYIVAIEKNTGTERWHIARPNHTRSYCVPLIAEAAGKMQLVLSGSKCVASYDPDTGRQHWIIDGPTEQFVATPVFTDDTFVITGGFPTLHIMGIRPDGWGNVTTTHVRWHDTHGASYVPSPIAFDRYVVVVSDDGLATCLEAKSGRRMWTQPLGTHHRPSPVCANGLLCFLADNGDMFVMKASPKFELVAKNSIGEDCYASPALSRGQIFIRSTKSLFCIGKP